MTGAVGAARAVLHAPDMFKATRWEQAAAAAAEHAPYLRRLIGRREEAGAPVGEDWAETATAHAIAEAHAIAKSPPPIEEAMLRLRLAKQELHLATALADLARDWDLSRTTGAITAFADASLQAALAVAVREMVERGVFADISTDPVRGPAPGIALIAMGKMGARELNYSSDIDFSVFFDAEILAARVRGEPRVAAVKLVAPLVRVLEEITADGYVFRTDLRLRPDPGSTPVAVSLALAETYYQSLGQNWERAAFIKARAAAGDVICGEEFLTSLETFIWRKHLDFAAVEDVHSIKRQILSAHGGAEVSDPVFDAKLGRGGIRDIELFAQTQQLILGGRNPALRIPTTLGALDALTERGALAAADRDTLKSAYQFFRHVEHRVQMLEDVQTHRVPRDREQRAHVAALAGFGDLAAFDAAVVEHRRVVSAIDSQLFGRAESLADPLGSLIFTGVEDAPETLETISKLGYQHAGEISQTIRGWHHGRIRAMRSERARELLTRLTPRLLRAFASAGDPDLAFARFSSFFSGLNAGVQVLALLDARPALLELLARLLTLAPALSDALSRRPALLDILIEPRFGVPLARDKPGERLNELRQRLKDLADAEEKLNAARRYQREEAFRIAAQLLERRANAREAGAAQSDLAEACVACMADVALEEMQRLRGPQPGAFAVLALGKFGGRELAEGADLDMMLVYDTPDGRGADYYARLTQRLISALSAATAEGALYEVDTKLRPSGSKGPVAVRFSSFERYYEEEAWVWELQALTRLRPIAGDGDLCARIADAATRQLAKPRDGEKTRAEVAGMRARMEREKPAKTFWDLKLSPGGFVDIEFIVQALQLVHADTHPSLLACNTGEAIENLRSAGIVSQDQGARLLSAWRLWSDLNQFAKLCISGEPLSVAPPPLQAWLSALHGAAGWQDLEARVRSIRTAVRADFASLVGALDGAA